MRVVLVRSLPSPNPISESHEAQSFATTVLELEPCWMDRAVQVPQRILVLQEGIQRVIQGIMKSLGPIVGGIKLAKYMGKFKGFPGKIVQCLGWE